MTILANMNAAQKAELRDALGGISILPNRRLPNVLTAIGDSRIAAIWLDSTKRNMGARSPLNWANALLGQRLIYGDCFGVSGDRTDQMLARLPAALATNAGLLYIQGGVNDIAEDYPTAGTSGSTAAANIKTIADAARNAGMTVIIEAEVGATNQNTSAKVAQINELNALLYDYAAVTPGVYLHDARMAVLNPNNSDTAIAFKAGYSSDGTHPIPNGAYYWGVSLAALIDRIVPPRAMTLGGNRIELPSNGRRQLLLNQFFQTATGGTLVNGATGTVPANWQGRRISTNTTLAFSTAANAETGGNTVIMDATFTAAGEEIRLYQDVSLANFQAGDIVETYFDIEVMGAAGGGGNPSGLAALYAFMTYNSGAGGASYDNADMIHGATAEAWPSVPIPKLTLKTRPFTILPIVGAGQFLTAQLRGMSTTGGGNARIGVKQGGTKRLGAAY